MLTDNEVKLVGTIISWPIVGLLSLLAIIWFRKPVAKGLKEFFKNRDLAAQLGKLGFNAPISDAEKKETQEAQKKQKARKSRKPSIPKAVSRLYQEKISAREQSIAVLQSKLAQTEAALDFEQIYNLCFGTQLQLLSFLAASPLAGFDASQLQQFVQRHMILAPNTYSDLPSFSQFLITRELAIHLNGRYIITEKGKAFLSYITSKNYTLLKTG